MAKDYVLAEEKRRVGRVGHQSQERIEEVVEHLNDRSLSNRASLEVLHAVLASEGDRLHLRDRVVTGGGPRLVLLLSVGPGGQVDHVADEDLDGDIAAITLINPLLDLFETASLRNIEHEEASGAAIDILMDVFVVTFAPWHVEVNYLVLVSVIDVVSCLDMKFC